MLLASDQLIPLTILDSIFFAQLYLLSRGFLGLQFRGLDPVLELLVVGVEVKHRQRSVRGLVEGEGEGEGGVEAVVWERRQGLEGKRGERGEPWNLTGR